MVNDNFTLQSTDRNAASGNAESTWEECCQIEDASIKAMQLAAGISKRQVMTLSILK